MVSAIGSSNAFHTISTSGESVAAIEAQLALYQKELSNCVNCESANTKQGQADIQALSSKISLAEARLQEIKSSTAGSQPGAINPPTAGGRATNTNAVASIAEGKSSGSSGAAQISPDSTAGSLVDVFV